MFFLGKKSLFEISKIRGPFFQKKLKKVKTNRNCRDGFGRDFFLCSLIVTDFMLKKVILHYGFWAFLAKKLEKERFSRKKH